MKSVKVKTVRNKYMLIAYKQTTYLQKQVVSLKSNEEQDQHLILQNGHNRKLHQSVVNIPNGQQEVLN